MMWAVQDKWPNGPWFEFNWYRHWATLLIRSGNGMSHLLHIKGGVTQGDPLAMITYDTGIPPLIQDLWTAHPRVTHQWYADDDGAGGTFAGILRHLDNLTMRGPPYGYFPEPTKSILVMYTQNIPRGGGLLLGVPHHFYPPGDIIEWFIYIMDI